MAKVTGYNPPHEVEELLQKSLMKNWNGVELVLTLKNREASYYKLNTIAGRSRLAVCGALWRAVGQQERDFLAQEGAKEGVSGWHLAVMNFCTASKQFGVLSVYGMLNRSGNAGCIYSPQLGQTIRIRQGHPLSYYVKQKIVGTRGRFEPVIIHEPQPTLITYDFLYSMGSLNDGYYTHPYTSEYGENYLIRGILRLYQGQFRGNSYIEKTVDLGLPKSLEQVRETEQLNFQNYAGYDFIFEVRDFKGLFFFDTVRLEHNGFNWALDWRCKEVEKINKGHLAICRNAWEIEKTYTGAKLFSRTYRPPA